MAEYIEREKLQEALKRKRSTVTTQRYTDGWNDCLLRVKSMVHSAPAADAAPVRRGCWEGTADGYADGALVFDMWNCSECGFDADGAEEKPDWKFCPNCGARMDGGADNGV